MSLDSMEHRMSIFYTSVNNTFTHKERHPLKKKTLLIASLVASVMMMSACSIQTITDKIAPQAQGVILYDQQPEIIDKTIEQYDKELEYAEKIPFKLIEVHNQKTMLLTETAANDLLQKGLWNDIIHSDKVKPIDTLESFSAEQPLLFTNQKAQQQLTIDQTEYDIINGGNIVIGQTRKYADQFLIMKDKQWESVKLDEQMMGILHFSKKTNPKYELQNIEADARQLVTIR